MNRLSRATRRTRPVSGVLLLSAITVALALPVAALAQVIRIVDPPEWRESRPVSMQSRSPLRIAGFVSQAGGIGRVLVNGIAATLAADPRAPDSYNFERIIPIDSLTSQITIMVEPLKATPWTRNYTLELSTRPVDRGDVPPPDSAAGRAAAPAQSPARQLGRSNPWGGFKLRGIVYGAAAVAGVVFAQGTTSDAAEICETTSAGFDCFNRTTTEPSHQGLGFAVAGAAIAALAIDALLTSRKAGAMRASSGGDPDGLHIDAPSVSGSATGLRLDLLRLRFR